MTFLNAGPTVGTLTSRVTALKSSNEMRVVEGRGWLRVAESVSTKRGLELLVGPSVSLAPALPPKEEKWA